MAPGLSLEGGSFGSEDMKSLKSKVQSPKSNVGGARGSLALRRSLVLIAVAGFVAASATLDFGPWTLDSALAQSGRPTPPPPKPQPPSQSQGRRPVTPPAEETRPRRAGDEPQQDKPIKLKADLVTVI